MGGLKAHKSAVVAGPIVPQTRRVLKSATPAPACNPPDPNHAPTPRSLRDSGYRVFARWGIGRSTRQIRTTPPGVGRWGRQCYRVIDAWPTLPPAIHEAILAMLRAAE